MKFGKLDKVFDDRNLLLKNYLDPSLIPVLTYSNSSIVYNKLKINNPAVLFPLDGNGTYGDCVMCGVAHSQTVWNGLIGHKKIMSEKSVIKTYFKLTSGEDSGLSILNTLKYWHNRAINTEKIIVFAEINPKNHDHLKLAIELFGGVMLGMQVQKDAEKDFENGTIWTPGKLIPDAGHCIYGVDYDKDTISMLTWGGIQKGNYAWADCCLDEAYAIISLETKNISFDNGQFDEQTLLKDLQLITKN
jgi:hypothetical protein